MTVVALSIAGFDPSGGAGVLGDLAAFRAYGVHGSAVVTAVTAQDSRGVSDVWPLPPDWIVKQARAVLDDLPVGAIKIGMLGGVRQAEVVAGVLEDRPAIPLVVDPVIEPKAGPSLLDAPGLEVLRSRIFPRATLVTPNLAEAERFSGGPITDEESLRRAARSILAMGPRAVLVKGLRSSNGSILDLFAGPSGMREHARPWVEGVDAHGSGCALSSSIAAGLALGRSLEEAIEEACARVHRAILESHRVGRGAPFLRFAEQAS